MLISSSSIHHPLKPISLISLSIRIDDSPLSSRGILIPIPLIERVIRPNQLTLSLFFLIDHFSIVPSPIRQLNWTNEITQSGVLLRKFMRFERILEFTKLLSVVFGVLTVEDSRRERRYSVRYGMYLLGRSWAIFAGISHLNIIRITQLHIF